MIQITPHLRILVAVEPVDFRAGIDDLAAVCRKRLQADPMTGTLFVFGLPPAHGRAHPRLRRTGVPALQQALVDGEVPLLAGRPHARTHAPVTISHCVASGSGNCKLACRPSRR